MSRYIVMDYTTCTVRTFRLTGRRFHDILQLHNSPTTLPGDFIETKFISAQNTNATAGGADIPHPRQAGFRAGFGQRMSSHREQ